MFVCRYVLYEGIFEYFYLVFILTSENYNFRPQKIHLLMYNVVHAHKNCNTYLELG